MEAPDVPLDAGAATGPPGSTPVADVDSRVGDEHRLGPLPPELALLLDLEDPISVSRHAADVDWGVVATLANQHRLSARLAAVTDRSPELACSVPEHIQEQLRATLDRERARQQRALRELDEVCTALVAAGIRPVVLKGAALHVRGLVEIGHRPLTDLDLLVGAARVEQAAATLQRLGYRPIGSSTERTWARAHHYQDVPHRHPDRSYDIDLHWHIQEPTHRRGFPVATLETQEQALPSGTVVGVLDDVDLLTHLCLHFWNDREQGRPGALGQLADIASILRGFDVRLWALLRGRAHRRQHAQIIAACIALCDLLTTTQGSEQLPTARSILDDPRHTSFAIRRVLGTRPPQIQMLMVTPDVEYTPVRVATRVTGHLWRTWSDRRTQRDAWQRGGRCRDLMALGWRVVRTPWESAAEIALDRWAHALR